MGEELIALGISPEALADVIKSMVVTGKRTFVDGQRLEKIKPESYSKTDTVDTIRLYRGSTTKTNLIPLVGAACQILNSGVDPAVVHIDSRIDFYYHEER
jgi:hypothetical protein